MIFCFSFYRSKSCCIELWMQVHRIVDDPQSQLGRIAGVCGHTDPSPATQSPLLSWKKLPEEPFARLPQALVQQTFQEGKHLEVLRESVRELMCPRDLHLLLLIFLYFFLIDVVIFVGGFWFCFLFIFNLSAMTFLSFPSFLHFPRFWLASLFLSLFIDKFDGFPF